MNLNIKEIMEILFDIFYIVILWSLVFKMFKNINNLNLKNTKLAKTLAWAFAFLALGDTGHVGFRIIAYLKGGLIVNTSLLGFGKFATAITMTIFYTLLIIVWKLRYNHKYNYFTYILFINALARLIIITFPANEWENIVAPFNWVIYRNIPFLILGLGIDFLLLSSSIKENDKVFKWFSIMILFSYAFYTPVILFAHKIPAIGILMIPKTMAYLASAFITYYGVFKNLNKTNEYN